MVKAYISSPLRLDSINSIIEEQVREKLGIDVFLPISLHSTFDVEKHALEIAEACYKEIDESDIIILVVPFGLSVASEIGYAIHQKRLGKKKLIIQYFSGLGSVKDELMLEPYIDYQTTSLEELINLVGQLTIS